MERSHRLDSGALVVGLGQASQDVLGIVDHYPPVDQKAELTRVLEQGGGPVATALVALARWGVETRLLGTVGDDETGEKIRRELLAEKVNCDGLRVRSGSTSQRAFICVEAGSARRNIFWTRGSAPPLRAGEVRDHWLHGARILHLDGLQLEASLAAARLAREGGVVTVLDGGTLRPGTEELLPLIDHLVVSERFAAAFASSPRDALAPLCAFGAMAVTVTVGAAGSWTREREGETWHQPAFAVQAVDTTGCGDVFHGGYIYGLLQGWSLVDTVRFAAAGAALKARELGGRAGIPSLSDLNAFLSRQPNPALRA